MDLEKTINRYYNQMAKKYLITGAQYMAPVNHKVLDSMEHYAKVNNAEILVLPVKYQKNDEPILHERLQQHRIINGGLKLNDNIQIAKYAVRPQAIEPITGFARFAKSDKTTIFASPKQRMKPMPNDKDLPKVLMTTGFVTKPCYKEGFAISEKAKHDHKFGGVIVEIDDKKSFQYRHIDAHVNGKMYDLGLLYNGSKKPEPTRPFISYGDIHGVDRDPAVHKENISINKTYNPKGIVLHDLFDGKSINHWSQKKSHDLLEEYRHTKLSLEDEAKETLSVLQEYSSSVPKDAKVYVVKSNHDERIDRWLNENRFVYEPQNLYLGHKLWVDKADGKDPLYSLLSSVGKVPSNVVFLSRDENLNKYGVELGYHGDERMNGGRGSIRSKEHAYGKSVTGHTHSPEVLRDTYVLGTNTKLNLPYVSGNSSWMHTSGMVYPGGKVQLFNYVKGRHRF